ncbi:signal peptidase I [Entomospira culicis]|nr:signal peptidase I [Entomospira culicis]WDI37628.1 signal peptidase I [Entomospira culicis]
MIKQIFRYVLFIFLLIALLTFTKFALVATYRVEAEGMSPYYPKGSMVMANAFGLSDFYDHLPLNKEIKRGHVVLLQTHQEKEEQSWLGYLFNPGLRFISGNFFWIKSKKERSGIPHLMMKRVIALPGDRIRLEGNEVFVQTPSHTFFVSEFEASSLQYEITTPLRREDWLPFSPFSGDLVEYLLGEDEYFVLGDNRTLINDSRNFGLITKRDIHAVVLFKYLGR